MTEALTTSEIRRLLITWQCNRELRVPLGDCADQLQAALLAASPVSDGAALIAAERARQRLVWDRSHDAGHRDGSLAVIAATLATYGTDAAVMDLAGWRGSLYDPWGLVSKHREDRRRQLVIAGALIAAELDRLAAASPAPTELSAFLKDGETAAECVARNRADVDVTLGLLANALSQKDSAYAERDRLVCALSKLWPSHLARHPDEDVTWDNDWRWIVCIHGPTGQLTWHIHDNERGWFDHLSVRDGHWDGHTTDEKYQRLAASPVLQGEDTKEDLTRNGKPESHPTDPATAAKD